MPLCLRMMTDATGKKVALVDHSDLAQAPDNLSAGEVVAIVDHHKIGDVTTNNPIFFCAMPVGCTGTVLKVLYDLEGVAVQPKVAGMMLAAILSDTVNFKSPTCTDADKKAVAELKAIAGVERYGCAVHGYAEGQERGCRCTAHGSA